VKLVIRSGGNLILSKNLLAAKPSEMIAVDLPAGKTVGLQDDLVVAIDEEE
jgi:hypothetical protein